MKKLVSVLLIVAITLCLLPSCSDDSDMPLGAIFYIGDTAKMGIYVSIDGNTLTYEPKYSNENQTISDGFVAAYGDKNFNTEIKTKDLKAFYENLLEITDDWQASYEGDGEYFNDYWIVEIYLDGEMKTYEGYNAYPDNYEDYRALVENLCGDDFPTKVEYEH